MSRLLAGVVILEGITHIEDLPLEKFIDTVEKLKDKVATEKLDGANLWFGVDDKGFFTSREGKSKSQSRFYTVQDYPMVANYNGFRAAHLALEQVKDRILNVLQPGDMVEVEVLFGRQPNTVTYGANGLNYIVILRGIGTDSSKVDQLADALDENTVEVESIVISSPDGDKLLSVEEELTWRFTDVKPIDNSKVSTKDAIEKLEELKKFLDEKNEAFPTMTNREVAEVKLGSVDKMRRDSMKAERERTLNHIMNNFKIPIKETLLNSYVRKSKPRLQSSELDPSEDVGMEGVVLRDPNSDEQVKLVDKDVFTAMNTFNNFIRSSVSGLVRTNDQDASIELRGGAFGQAKIRIAELLGVKELAVSSTAKKTMTKFKGNTVEETAEKIASSINLESLPSIRAKISAILENAIEDVDDILIKFKNEAGTYKLKLKTGKEIGISPEVMKRNLTAFAETKRDINLIDQAVDKSRTTAELVMALYGRTIQSLFNGSDNVKESFSLLKKLSEEGEGSDIPAGIPAAVTAQPQTSKANAISPVPTSLLTKNTVKRKRTFVLKSKFAKPELAPTNESLIRLAEFDVANQNATDVDDTAAAKNDVEFKNLRNNVNLGDNVTDADINRYLDKAHELNDEVDTVTFGMEMDDGSIVKVYVNATQADGFEGALAQMLGEYDDVEEVINNLAQTFDIVDVEWPNGQNTATPGQDPNPLTRNDGAQTIDTTTATAPSVNPVIDLGDEGATSADTEPDPNVEEPEDGEDGDLSIDSTFFGDGEDEEDKDPDADSEVGTTAQADDDTTASDEEPSDEEPATDEEPAGDEVVGGEEATDDNADAEVTGDEEEESTEDDDEESSDKKSKKKKSTTSDEDDATQIKTEESMTIGQQFKARLLTEKKAPKKKKDDEVDAGEELDIAGLPSDVEKLLTSFPTRGGKAMVVLLYALGAPMNALTLKKADLRKGVAEAGERYIKDSQFRVWTKRLTEELLKTAQPANEAALEDELGNVLQRVILEIMQAVGLPEAVEKMARSTLRAAVRAKSKVAMSNPKIRQYLKIVAEMLGIDAATGNAKSQVKMTEGKNGNGEQEYASYASWKAAAKKKNPAVWFDGDKDIGEAMVGEQPFKKGKTYSIGEWDGEKGVIYKDEDTAKHAAKIAEETDTGGKHYDALGKALDAALKPFGSKCSGLKGETIWIDFSKNGKNDDIYRFIASDKFDTLLAKFGFAYEDNDYKSRLDRGRYDDFHVTVTGDGEVNEAAPPITAPVPGQGQATDETGNEWVDEIMKLVEALGIPKAVLDYRRKQTEVAVKQHRQDVQNYSLVLRNVKKLNQIISGNMK